MLILLLGLGARVDHRFKDGDTIRVGPIALTAHITGGATRGCTSWSFVVRDGDRVLKVVSACSLVVVQGMRYPEQGADLERSFRVLRSLPADIWVTPPRRNSARAGCTSRAVGHAHSCGIVRTGASQPILRIEVQRT